MNYSRLKFDIERGDISIRQLCKNIGINHSGFYKSLAKESITLNVFEKICFQLKLNPNDYFELDHLDPSKPMSIDRKLETIKQLVNDVEMEYTLKQKKE